MSQSGRRNADHLFLTALACGATIEKAAASAGIGLTTAYRRLKDPEFQHEFSKTKAEMVSRTAGMLTAAAGEAVKTLLALVKAPNPPSIQLGASRAILELGVSVRQSAELEERMAAVEAQLAESNRSSPP
jgi:hypothetical protein